MEQEKSREDYYSHIRLGIVDFIPDKTSSLLDIGCANGDTAFYLKKNKDIKIVEGIELFADAATRASEKIDKVYNVNLNAIKISDIINKKFECILLLDVLEHLIDPINVLLSTREIIVDDGIVVISLPNVRHYSVLFPLLFKNRWDYEESGVLDKTHLHFYTYHNMVEMINACGFKINKVRKDFSYTRGFKIFNILTFSLFNSFSIFQYYFLCTKNE